MRIFTIFVFFLNIFCLNGQQDPLFTKYKFNALIFNPAYAGSNEHLSLNLIHRQQWVGLDGSPKTQSLTAHTPLKNERVGLGATILNDRVGATARFEFNTAYAYIAKLKNGGTLAIGIQGGFTNWHSDWFEVVVEHGTDEVFREANTVWAPNFGAGIYYHTKTFYAGFSAPRLIEYKLSKQDRTNIDFAGRNFRHYYATVGAVFPFDDDRVVFRPSVLIKSTGLLSSFRTNTDLQNIGSPTGLDIDAGLFFNQTFGVGVAFRTALELRKSSFDSADLWAAWQLSNGMRLGFAYDMTLSQLRKVSSGSFELMLGYEFDVKVKKVSSIRYF